jgi:hypothetical protein
VADEKTSELNDTDKLWQAGEVRAKRAGAAVAEAAV